MILSDDLYTGIEASLGQIPEEAARGARQSIQRLRQAGVISLERLADVLNDAASESSIKLAACDVLARLGEPYRRSAEALADLFAQTDEQELLWESAKALAQMNVRHVAELLQPCLDSADSVKAAAAAWTLGRLGDRASVAPLRAVVRRTSAPHDVRAHAAEALGVLESRDAVLDLVAALEDSSAEVRYWSAYALGQIGDPGALPALDRLALSDRAKVGTSGSVAEVAASAADMIRRDTQA